MMKGVPDVSIKIEAALKKWYADTYGYPIPMANGSIQGVATALISGGMSLDKSVELLPPFLATLDRPRGAWLPFLIGCLRMRFEQFAIEHEAKAQHRERALKAAADALAEAKAKACPRCEGYGMVGARPDCVADVREGLKHGAVLCECEAGKAWRGLL